MLIELILFLFLGIFAGTISGLIPGIHINLIGVIFVSLSVSLFYSVLPIYFVVFIVAMAITHTFVDFIPSILLGCPDTDTELSVLPGHELLKKGNGYEAILLAAYGGLLAMGIMLLISPSFFIVNFLFKNKFSEIYSVIKPSLPILLSLVSIFLIYTEKKKLNALFVFLLTGMLGILILNPNELLGKSLELSQPLLPLLTGLFGSSMLILSIKSKVEIPQQQITKPDKRISKQIAKAFLGSAVASPLCGFLPGLGSGQAAILGNAISKTDRKGFLILLGATNTLVMVFSFISLYAISKTRTGATVAIQQLIGNISDKILILMLITTLLSGLIAFCLTIFLAKYFSQKIRKIKYTTLSFFTLGVLLIIVFLISGFLGLIVLIASTLTGIYCISLKVKRTNMMGCLLLPTILFYLVI